MIELSVSGLQDWRKCQRLWALLRYYEHEEPTSVWLAIGRSVHQTIQLVGQEPERPIESIFKEQFKEKMRGVPTNGLPIRSVVHGLVSCLGQIDWKAFIEKRQPRQEVYFSKKFGSVHFRGYVDLVTSDNVIYEWKTTSKKSLPVQDHVEQGSIYREMLEARKVYLVYFTWRNGQVKAFELPLTGSSVPQIERTADQIERAIKLGVFKETGDCKGCWARDKCQEKQWL